MIRAIAAIAFSLLLESVAQAHVLAVPFPDIGNFQDVELAALGTVGGRVASVTPTPATANIPIASLSNGSYAANNWAGFTTNATTASNTSGREYLQTTTSSSTNTLAIGTDTWRDAEVTYYITKGRVILRGSQGGSGIYLNIALDTASSLRIGIVTNINYSDPEGGTKYPTYVQDNPAACITGWPTTSASTFTFGVRGFEVYLLINGVQAYDTCQTTAMNPLGAIRYYEYRPQAMQAGKVSVWAHGGSEGGGAGNQITATYFALTNLNSNYASNSFDIRDFGARTIPAVTGSMSAASCTLTLASSRDFRVNDQIIVELGGEAGAGAYNTVGVGGSSPELHYANDAARSADTSKASGTYAYIDTDGTVKKWNGTTWAVDVIGGYYSAVKAPAALIARVTAINASPATTLTLNVCASVATSGANVYLDTQPAFYPMTTNPAAMFANRNDGLTQYQNMTITAPAGSWPVSGVATALAISAGDRTGLTITGAGVASTNFFSPKGAPSALFNGGSQNSTVTYQDFTYTGNLADSGYMWAYTGANKNFPGDTPIAMEAGQLASNAKVQRVKCVNDMRGCAVLQGTNPQILNPEVAITVGQRTYFQWQFMLSNCTGGQINGITATGTYLLKLAELFACNGATMTNVTATNGLFSVNSSTSSTLSNITSTITTDAFFDQGSGWLDEPIININVNAFGSGNTGTLSNFRLVQNGYTQVSSTRNLKSIQVQSAQTDWTISGSYPGGGGCTSALGGYAETPDYNSGGSGAGSNYGAMLVYSDAARTIVNNVRIKGAAIGTPGHSSHWGNISLLGASSQVNNSVVDVIQPGPTTSGNQTNAAYGGC